MDGNEKFSFLIRKSLHCTFLYYFFQIRLLGKLCNGREGCGGKSKISRLLQKKTTKTSALKKTAKKNPHHFQLTFN